MQRCKHHEPSQNVWFPLQPPFASQYLISDPLKRNPSSQLKVILFGKTVRSPVEEPFVGTARGPQSFAEQKIAMWVKNYMVPCRLVKTWNDDKFNLTRNVYCKVLQGLWSFAYNIPTHRAARPLQVPFAWHILVDDPLRLNPGSHLNITLFRKTVESPKDEPFVGTDKGPQSTATRKQKETVCTSKQDSMKQEIRKL